MSLNQFSLLKTRRFLPLFLTQFFGAFNDNVFKNALVILITYRLAKNAGINAQIMVTLAAGLFILPFFLFSATAGQLADKYERSRLISIIKFAEILLMMLAVLGLFWQSVPILMLVLFLLGVQATFFGPLKYAILPDHLHENELMAGNGLIEAGTFLAILLGTILGGIMILTAHGELFISVAILTIALTGWLSSWFIPKTAVVNATLNINYNFITETLIIIKQAKQHWDIFLTILGIAWFWFVGATFLAELPVFVKDTLHANEHVVTFFFTIFSIGIGLGSILCNKILKGRINTTYVPLAAVGISLFTIDLFLASHHHSMMSNSTLLGLDDFLATFTGWRIVFDLTLIAICGGLYTVPLYVILQHRSPAPQRANIIATSNIVAGLFMVLSALATMLMLSLGFSVPQVFLMTALVNGVVAFYICKLLPEALLKSILQWILLTLFNVQVTGLENYDRAGKRAVIIANHTSFLDAALLAAFLPDKLTFAVNTHTSQKWWIKFFLLMVDAYPLDPTKPLAIKTLIKYVALDKKCVIFPEGRITVTGALMKIYEGPGLIADKAQACLLPIHIQGAKYTVFSRLKGIVRIRWFPPISITIFPPRSFEVSKELRGRKRRQYIGNWLYDIMTEVLFEGSHYQQTLFNGLIDAMTTHGRRHEIIEDINRVPIDYQRFLTSCFILGAKLAKITQPGEVVGMLLPNMANTLITFFALQAYGRVSAMINFSTGSKNCVVACQTAQIKNVLTSREFVEVARLTDMIDQLSKIGVTVHYLEDVRPSVNAFNKFCGLVMAQWPRFFYKRIHPHADPQSPAVVLFTSGSEGTPKGVVLSHANIQANRFQLSARVDFKATDRIFNALPMFHSFGLTGGSLLPVLAGMKTFFYPSPLHYRIIPELSYDTNATIIFGTNTFLNSYAKYAHPYDFYSVRYVFAGAEKLQEETHKMWSQKFGVRIFEGYGATETSPALSTNTPMQNKPGTVGRLLPGIRYQIKPVPGIDEGGALSVAGPNVMLGYFLSNNPGIIVPPAEGWYDMGDIVSFDDEGYITIKGRLKRFAKISGEMISLGMVEQYINALWPSFNHAVINMPDPKKGELLVLVTTHQQAARDAIIAYAKANGIGEIAIPRVIEYIDKLPLLGTGKTDYVKLKEWLTAKMQPMLERTSMT